MELTYHPEIDIENLEGYVYDGYHPTLIGDTFGKGRYKVVHKLGFGGYSTIWLARDQIKQRYVALKILAAWASRDCTEADVLRHLNKDSSTHAGRRFTPPLLDDFSFDGPNGHHRCLVGEPTGCNIAQSKEDSSDFMFPPDAARSAAAQLLLGVSYLHKRDICHGDLHLRNILLRTLAFRNLSADDLYGRFGKPSEVPVRRRDGEPGVPHAPPHAIYPMIMRMPANKLDNPNMVITDYGTSFIASKTPSPSFHTPALYAPPEVLLDLPIDIPTAADIWTLGVTLYEVLGERPLFETFAGDPDDVIGEMVSTLGKPPQRLWEAWAARAEFFNPDGSWAADYKRIASPVSRRLHQRMWDMGRGETEQTCAWDVAGGEFRALEEMLRAMLAFEPAERPTADRLLKCEYMTKWALPAWERQKQAGSKAYNVTSAEPNLGVKRGNSVWPAEMMEPQKETHTGPPALVGRPLVAWASE